MTDVAPHKGQHSGKFFSRLTGNFSRLSESKMWWQLSQIRITGISFSEYGNVSTSAECYMRVYYNGAGNERVRFAHILFCIRKYDKAREK